MSRGERLQKVLASCGVASRRRSEELITEGRVRVDGRIVTELGTRVDPRRQRVEVDGRRVVHDVLVYIVLHKPRGIMSTLRDPEGRPTVAHQVRDLGIRVAPVGRLDFNTSGVLLLTNDGDFASGLSHPRAGVPKDYLVKVRGRVDDAVRERLASSIEIETKKTVPAAVAIVRREGDKTWLRFTLKEGKNRQVRRLVEHAGLSLMRLSRVAYAGIGVQDLSPGCWRVLTQDELKQLKRAFGVPKRVKATDRAFFAGVPTSGGEALRRPGAGGAGRGGRNARRGDASEATRRAPSKARGVKKRPTPARAQSKAKSSTKGAAGPRRPTQAASRTKAPKKASTGSLPARSRGKASTRRPAKKPTRRRD